jgi:carbonic anhydrase
MVRQTIRRRTGDARASSRAVVPATEVLETRSLLSRSPVTMGIPLARLDPSLGGDQTEAMHPGAGGKIGTISGTVFNSVNGRALPHVRVQLINSNGFVARRTLTGPRGRYSFPIFTNGPYVIREVTPRRWTQTSPTFDYRAPTGSYAPGYNSKSWIYNTGNTDPANGPVGVYGWSSIAPAGNLPFQSPINIAVPPINLSRYLSLNLPNAVADVENHGHDIAAVFSGSSQTINLGGTTFSLVQLHFHDPSDNQVDGNGYSMEEHIVFRSATGALAVVAVFLQLGASNPSLQPILDAAPTTPSESMSNPAPIDFSGLLPSSLQGWFYVGSLTAPPLSQPVNFLVLSTPITLSFAQLQQYEAIASASGFLPSARPVQPLDGRQVNQFNIDVDFQNQSVAGLSFGLARRV